MWGLIQNSTEFSYKDGPGVSAFGRARVDNTDQRFDVEFIYDKQPLFFTERGSGAGSVTHNAGSRDVSLIVGDDVEGSYRDLCQNWHNPYTPGNGQLIDITGTLNGNNISGGTCEIFHKSGIDSSETIYTQQQWTNKVFFDDVNWSYSQIFQIDFQSLKVGRIRFNIVRNGRAIEAHQINNDNKRLNGYWQYPSLPIRFRIINTATETLTEIGYFDDNNGVGFRFRVPVNATQTCIAICGTVKSEGGKGLFEIPGIPFSVDLQQAPKTVSTALVPLITIRPRETFNSLPNKSIIIPEGFNIQTDNPIRIAVMLNVSLTGASFQNVSLTNSVCEYDIAATTFSSGLRVDSNYIASGNNSRLTDKGVTGRNVLSVKPDASVSSITLAAIRTANSDASVFASVKWREIR